MGALFAFSTAKAETNNEYIPTASYFSPFILGGWSVVFIVFSKGYWDAPAARNITKIRLASQVHKMKKGA
ncbi:hypothetical protein VIRA109638_03220 [Vibrio rarus]